MTFPPEILDTLLKDYQNPEDLLGESGILKQLTKALVECCLELKIRLKERKGKYPDRGNQRDLRKGNHRIVIKLLF
jgi:hypothetical protein